MEKAGQRPNSRWRLFCTGSVPVYRTSVGEGHVGYARRKYGEGKRDNSSANKGKQGTLSLWSLKDFDNSALLPGASISNAPRVPFALHESVCDTAVFDTGLRREECYIV